MDSIFLTIKNSLGVESSFTGFDADILLGINSAIMRLNQIGLGPTEGLVITGPDQTWSQLIGAETEYEGVKVYILLKTRLFFDPPATSFVLEAIKNQIQELEWCLNVQAESTPAP